MAEPDLKQELLMMMGLNMEGAESRIEAAKDELRSLQQRGQSYMQQDPNKMLLSYLGVKDLEIDDVLKLLLLLLSGRARSTREVLVPVILGRATATATAAAVETAVAEVRSDLGDLPGAFVEWLSDNELASEDGDFTGLVFNMERVESLIGDAFETGFPILRELLALFLGALLAGQEPPTPAEPPEPPR